MVPANHQKLRPSSSERGAVINAGQLSKLLHALRYEHGGLRGGHDPATEPERAGLPQDTTATGTQEGKIPLEDRDKVDNVPEV